MWHILVLHAEILFIRGPQNVLSSVFQKNVIKNEVAYRHSWRRLVRLVSH